MKSVYYFKSKWTKKETIMRFLFLLYPIKIRKHLSLLIIVAILIAFGLIIPLFTIPVLNTGIVISFTWLPTLLTGWIFGPIPGMIIGFVIDSLCYLINGGIWYWLYAIQEPIVGIISGLISFLYLLFKNHKNSYKINFIFCQIIIHLFLLFTISTLFINIKLNFNIYDILFDKNKIGDLQLTTLLIIVCIFLLIFYLVIQIFNIYKYKKHTNNSYFFISSSLCIIITFIFSFILGPISTIEFYKYINGKPPGSFIKYGYFYYLIPRIIKECFKTPIYIVLFSSCIYVINYQIKKIINNASNSWIK